MTRKRRRAADYLDDMLECIQRIRSFVGSANESTFLGDAMLQDAVIRNLGTIGEATRHLMQDAPDLLRRAPEVPWKAIHEMRNQLLHGYMTVDLQVVWDTVCTDLDPLEAAVRKLRTSLADESP